MYYYYLITVRNQHWHVTDRMDFVFLLFSLKSKKHAWYLVIVLLTTMVKKSGCSRGNLLVNISTAPHCETMKKGSSIFVDRCARVCIGPPPLLDQLVFAMFNHFESFTGMDKSFVIVTPRSRCLSRWLCPDLVPSTVNCRLEGLKGPDPTYW